MVATAATDRGRDHGVLSPGSSDRARGFRRSRSRRLGEADRGRGRVEGRGMNDSAATARARGVTHFYDMVREGEVLTTAGTEHAEAWGAPGAVGLAGSCAGLALAVFGAGNHHHGHHHHGSYHAWYRAYPRFSPSISPTNHQPV